MKNRIKAHRTVKVKDLVPHELNPRTHTDAQRSALEALIGEVGFARSLLAYELPDGRLKLIDGHLRQDTLDPDEEVTVEVLDVSDDEAKKLLLAIDPLAQLAGYDASVLDQLRAVVEQDSAAVTQLWAAVDDAQAQAAAALAAAAETAAPRQTKRRPGGDGAQELPEQFLVLIECDDERHQVTLLRKFKKEGLRCTAKTS